MLLGGNHPMLLPEISCVCILSFRSVGPRVCLAKGTFLALFWPDLNTEKVWPYRRSLRIPLVKLIPNIYGFVGLTPPI